MGIGCGKPNRGRNAQSGLARAIHATYNRNWCLTRQDSCYCAQVSAGQQGITPHDSPYIMVAHVSTSLFVIICLHKLLFSLFLRVDINHQSSDG
jgi:hypothetical protein